MASISDSQFNIKMQTFDKDAMQIIKEIRLKKMKTSQCSPEEC